ncbi:hypothetical protein EV356DRAFT_508619, partial [Viridothelium virens]
MICTRCLARAARLQNNAIHATPNPPIRSRKVPRRNFISSSTYSSKSISPNAATTTAPRQGTPSSRTPPAATSTSAAQPFSTPLTPSPEAAGIPTTPSERPSRLIQSSVPAGTPLKGLSYIKGETDPLAKEDEEYPDWLWDILRDSSANGEGGDDGQGGAGDQFAKSKKQRRIAAKEQRKRELLNPESMAPRVPLYEQSIDLPGGDGTIEGALAAGEAREGLTRAMRAKRRSSIKEDNFLRAM